MPTDVTRYLLKCRTGWQVCLLTLCAIVPAGAGGCDSVQAGKMVGQTLTPELAQHILKIANAAAIRVLPPNEPITGEWRSDRVNVQVDAAGTVLQIRCG